MTVCPGDAELSIVVQGPCARQDFDGVAPSIDAVLQSCREVFPQAELIVSTWLGSDVAGLDADAIILNRDPGSLDHPLQRQNNINRMVLSTAKGLALATRPYCIKTRSDVVFRSDRLIRNELAPAAEHLGLERRIWSASIGTARTETYLRPFHPCDMVQFGLTADLRQLWDLPLFTWSDVFLPDLQMGLPRMCPEQALFIGFLRRKGITASIDMTIDGRPNVLTMSLDTMLGAFDVFDEAAHDVAFPPRLANAKHTHLMETQQSFDDLRAGWMRDREAAAQRLYAAFHARMNDLLAGRIAMAQDPAKDPAQSPAEIEARRASA